MPPCGWKNAVRNFWLFFRRKLRTHYGRQAGKNDMEIGGRRPAALNGKAISKKVVLYFDGTETGPSMQPDITLPKQSRPRPMYMLAEWGSALPEILDRGYGIVICKLTQIQPDSPDRCTDSIRAFFAPPGQKEPKPDEWGAIGDGHGG